MHNHQFPPTLWQKQDWSISGLSVFLGLTLLAGIWCLVKRGKGWVDGAMWSVCFAVFGLMFLNLYAQGDNGSRRIQLLEVSLNAFVLIVIVIGAVKFWHLTIDQFSAYEGIAIVVIVVGVYSLVTPSVGTPLQSVTRTQCKNNLKQIGLALHNYHDENARFPSAAFGQPPQSWRISLLPFLNEPEVADRYDTAASWDSKANLPVSLERASQYDCPQRPKGRDRNSAGQFLTAYVGPIGDDTIFADAAGIQIRDITDGTSNTLMILEACGSEIVWTEPKDIPVTEESVSVNQAGAKIDSSNSILSSYHSGGAQVLLSDGSGRFVSENIDQEVLAALLTRNGGENIGEW